MPISKPVFQRPVRPVVTGVILAVLSPLPLAEQPVLDENTALEPITQAARAKAEVLPLAENAFGLSEGENPGVVFKPTEEVSEDLSVPFPVDI